MAKWQILSARIAEESEYYLLIDSPASKRQRRFFLLFLLLFGVGGVLFSLPMGLYDVAMEAGLFCLAPAVLLLFFLPLSRNLHLDGERNQMVLTTHYLLGLGQWSRKRQQVVDFASITHLRRKENWDGSKNWVTISTTAGKTISLQFSPKRGEKTEANRLQSWLAERVESGGMLALTMEEPAEIPEASVTSTRLGLAAVFGLLTALVCGYLWYLGAIITSTRYGILAVFVGLLVGQVVTIMAGANMEIRFSFIGMVMAGIGVAFGDYLLFGLPESQFVFELSPYDFLFYGLALWQGWIIPRRSTPLAWKFRQVIHEGNEKAFLVAGAGLLVVAVGVIGYTDIYPSFSGTSAKSHYNQANMLWVEGKIEESVAAYEAAIEAEPDFAAAHYELGLVHLYDLGNFPEAESSFKKAIEIDPEWAEPYIYLADLYAMQSLPEEGKVMIDEALRLDPESSVGHYILGEINLNLGNRSAAKIAFKKTIVLEPAFVDAHLMLGMEYFYEYSWDAAIESFTGVLEQIDGSQYSKEEISNIYSLRAYSHMAMSHIDEATADSDNALEENPDNGYAHFVRGWALAEDDDTETAVKELQLAIELGLSPYIRQDAEAMLDELAGG